MGKIVHYDSGLQVGRLTLVGPSSFTRPSCGRFWEFRCVCGATVLLRTGVVTRKLRNGVDASCGCIRKAEPYDGLLDDLPRQCRRVDNSLINGRYFGKTCNVHPEFEGLRTNRGNCVQCTRDKSKQWQISNPERYHENQNRWRAANVDEVRARARKRYDSDPARVKTNVNLWRDVNPHKVAEYRVQRRCSTKQRTPAWADRKAIRAIYRKAQELGLTVDHVIPLQGELVSGLHVENNLRLLDLRANASKSNKFDPNIFAVDGLDL